MDPYRFKIGQEALWFAIVAGVAAALQIAQSTDPTTITDWRVYATSLVIAAARAALAALWNAANKVT